MLQITDCEKAYKSLTSVPNNDDISLDTIRGFFKAYLLHKQFINYVINLNKVNLVDKNWIIQSKAQDTYTSLTKLQSVLNFNVKNLFLLVRKKDSF